jgi:hypothetical protein
VTSPNPAPRLRLLRGLVFQHMFTVESPGSATVEGDPELRRVPVRLHGGGRREQPGLLVGLAQRHAELPCRRVPRCLLRGEPRD